MKIQMAEYKLTEIEAETEIDICVVLNTYRIQSATFWGLVVLSLFNQGEKIKAERI